MKIKLESKNYDFRVLTKHDVNWETFSGACAFAAPTSPERLYIEGGLGDVGCSKETILTQSDGTAEPPCQGNPLGNGDSPRLGAYRDRGGSRI